MLRRPLSLVLSSDSYHVSLALTHEIRHALHYGKSMERFFEEVDGRLKAARQADSDSYRGFFDALKPTLEMAAKLDRELNRHLAQRFNALEYLRTSELGLSRIIADLLKAGDDTAHGQGPLFLRIFLTKLGIGLTLSDSDLRKAKVFLERQTEDRRRIDIFVEIPRGDGTFRLAIENKPYTGDSENQVKDYLEYLLSISKGGDFLLIYLSPNGEGPSEHSLPSAELESWREQFIIMPYQGQYSSGDAEDDDQATDVFREYRASCSLSDWLAACREKCQAERLRWFLGETESFCKRKFGDQTMTTSSETEALENYLHANPDHFLTSQVIYDSWADIKKRICERFLNQICHQVELKIRNGRGIITVENIDYGCECAGDAPFNCNLWFYRDSWKKYKDAKNDKKPKTTTIWLQNQNVGPKNFIYGVASPLSAIKNEFDKKRRKNLVENLRLVMDGNWKSNTWWPIYAKADESKQDWNKILRELHQECEDNGGKITEYYVRELVDLATQVIPIIDKIENEPA